MYYGYLYIKLSNKACSGYTFETSIWLLIYVLNIFILYFVDNKYIKAFSAIVHPYCYNVILLKSSDPANEVYLGKYGPFTRGLYCIKKETRGVLSQLAAQAKIQSPLNAVVY